MDTLARFLLVSAIVLFALVFYRWLLRFLKRGSITEPYPYIYPLVSKQLSSETVLQFDLPKMTNIKCELLPSGQHEGVLLFSETFDKGMHSKQVDVSNTAPGLYDLKFTFHNQVITRPVQV